MILKRNCQQTAALLLAREDRSLSLEERLALRLHLAMCDACPLFAKQVLTMRNAFTQWRNQVDQGSDAAPADPPERP
ncbi:zf-HC2 domain-containing protein [Curvibacter sp. HBC61]|uniref:Zf-HC2 domain-containing protein n=1 Tax=Curvibacter cyanobacteriorum TaxID=3026422 RepID=A0ABT5MZH7_9BURK|nr:zf-HC2 domain-containing protein [Curvibacter sp. HBC61]MDD0839464.1 zf-HC2 domain-containing protein [Curvibacter sp. HBC61]